MWLLDLIRPLHCLIQSPGKKQAAMLSSSHTAEKSSNGECQKEKDSQGCHHSNTGCCQCDIHCTGCHHGDTNTAKCEHSHHQMNPKVAWLYEATHKGNRPPEETCKIYDQHADDYEKVANKYPCEKWAYIITEVINTKILKDKSCRILDVGAGTGASGYLLQKHGYTNIDALDGSEQMLEIAKTKNIYHNFIHIILKDGVRIPNVENDTYTAVVMNAVFCPNHCDSSVFPELIRVVKPGGYICWSMNTDEATDVDKFNSDVEKLCEERKWKSVFEKFHKSQIEYEKVVVMEVL